MNDAAGLNDSSFYDVAMGVFYGITALILLVTAFILFTRKFRRNKIVAINQLEFITSRYNVYDEDTQFLFNVPYKTHVLLQLIDDKENLIETLVDRDFDEGEHIYHFKISPYKTGLYYLKLHADNVDMLRKIKINHQ
jgi:hypothetical protein